MASVYNIHSTLELPMDELEDLLNEVVLPTGIEKIETERKNNMFFIESSPDDSVEVGRYVPTAKIKASIQEKRVYIQSSGERTTTPHQVSPSVEDVQEEEQETELVEYACFKGYDDTVLHNQALKVQMFDILQQIALASERGELEGIVCNDEGLTPVKIVDGEEQNVTVELVDVQEDTSDEDSTTVDWQSNDYI